MARLRRLAKENSQQQSKPKILFVDDEERILNSLRALFRLNYDVTVTTDGYHALELLQREHFHLLVSDQRMPVMQGVELLRRARNVSPNTVRILLTGFPIWPPLSARSMTARFTAISTSPGTARNCGKSLAARYVSAWTWKNCRCIQLPQPIRQHKHRTASASQPPRIPA
ncbi:MAG: response regulator [Thiolinea sp.]